MNIIYFQPASQITNAGDILINKALLDLLREKGKIIFNDKGRPEWFVKECTSEKDVLLSEISKKDLYASIEDELTTNPNSQIYLFFPPGHSSRKGLKNAYRRMRNAFRLLRLKNKGCKIVRVGFSIGPFDLPNAVAEWFYNCAFYEYGLREKISYDLAKQLKLRTRSFFPDLAWSYNLSHTLPELKGNQEGVVLSFRSNTYGIKHDPNYLNITREKLLNLLRSKFSKETKITIVYQVLSDRTGMEELATFLRDHFENTQFLDKNLSLEEASEIYSKSQFVISNRLHVLLFALINGSIGIPFIEPLDNKKIVGIFSVHGLDELILERGNTQDAINQSFNHILVNEVNIRQKLNRVHLSVVEEMRDKIHRLFQN
jgi:polysaccharide pyruvyl transferase WcaK-like protein